MGNSLQDQLKRYLSESDEVMVVDFGGTTEVVLPMTRNRSALKKVLREEKG